MKEKDNADIRCGKCNVPLETEKTELWYQKQGMSANLLRCPKCGQVFISEELVKGKMFEVEKALEDK
jgi:uncharacterized protein with PIN domain